MRIFKIFWKGMRSRKVLFGGLEILLLGIFSSCTHERWNPGYSYFPDMEKSRAFETYTSNSVFKNGLTNQMPPEGTVSMEVIPYSFVKDEEDAKAAGLSLNNPYVSGDIQSFNRGKEVYSLMCANCHGEVGDGKGFLYTSGRYPYPPANLTGDRAMRKKEGELFHNVSIGYGVMGAHQNIVSQGDRWRVVRYVRDGIQK